MPYTPTDPREDLMTKGNVLLDLIYQRHIWEQKYSDLDALMRKGDNVTQDEIMAATTSPEFISALVESLEINGKFERAHTTYLMLRQTIEALEAVRPSSDVFGDN